MSISLSIDLDFWSGYQFSGSGQIRNICWEDPLVSTLRHMEDLVSFRPNACSLPNYSKRTKMRNMLERVCKLPERVPVRVVEEHDQILPYVNEQPCDMLINVDAHDDICGLKSFPALGPGNWVDFVQWRKSSTYKWIYPTTVREYAYCGGEELWKNPKQTTDWAKIVRSTDQYAIKWDDVVMVNICMSPDFTFPLYGLYAMSILRKGRPSLYADDSVTELERSWLLAGAADKLRYF